MVNIFNEFDAVSAEKWKAQLEKDLKGVGFDQLTKIDRNGISVFPFYTSEDVLNNTQSNPIFENKDWDVIQHIVVTNETTSNALILKLLNDGVSGLYLEVRADVNLEILLAGVEIQFITIVFKVVGDKATFNQNWQQYLDKKLEQPNSIFIIGGTNNNICINGSHLNNRGANSATELLSIIGELNEELFALEQQDALHTFNRIYIQISIDTTFFEQIAKLRALRILVNTICHAYNINAELYVHGVTSHIYRSHVDMHSNMLRDTLSAMASKLGGANGITVYPYDYMVQEATSFSHRMAKNIQLILREEAYLNQVSDVSNGSHYLESLTKELVDLVWHKFLDIEKRGGYKECFNEINNAIDAQAQCLIKDYEDGKKVLIGVNKHINKLETDQPQIRPIEGAETGKYINIAQLLF